MVRYGVDDPNAKGRRFIFTLNHPTEEETPDSILEWPGIQFIVFQKEKGATSGIEHYQGYFELSGVGQQRISTLKRRLNGRAYFAVAQGNVEDGRKYSTKEATRIDGPWERGVPRSGQGHRSDLVAVADQVKQSLPMRVIAENNPTAYIKYYRGILALRQQLQEVRKEATKGIYIWGPAGTGKTTWTRDRHPGAYWKSADQWWQNYDSEEVVVFDEWLCNHHRITDMNQLISNCPYKVQTKGGSVEFVAKTVIVISNVSLFDAYRNCPQEVREAFMGRFEYFHKLEKRSEPIRVDNPFYTQRNAA